MQVRVLDSGMRQLLRSSAALWFPRAAVAAFCMAAAACSSAPVSPARALDARMDWPCEVLAMEWDAVRVVEPAQTAARSGALAQPVRLEIARCRPEAALAERPPVLAYSLLLSPMPAAEAPIVITGVPDDSWFRLRQMIAGAAAADVFSEFAYDMLPATFDFAGVADQETQTVVIAIPSAPGRIEVEVLASGAWRAAQSAAAIAAGGDGFVSAWFGAQQYEARNARARLTVSGETPLAALAPPAGWLSAQWRRGRLSDRVYWRLPAE